jgi:hypothetical protein
MKPIRLTEKRLMWLRHLKNGPSERRGHGGTGYYCMQAGWTEWDFRDKETGEPVPHPAPGEWDKVTHSGERLTEAGRKLVDAREPWEWE